MGENNKGKTNIKTVKGKVKKKQDGRYFITHFPSTFPLFSNEEITQNNIQKRFLIFPIVKPH
jgi:hypothetical protein